jgi:subtilisin-like proprotein convertase family protein/subtilisin family serine protease
LWLIFAAFSCPVWALPFSSEPNDVYWPEQWYLENLGTNAVRLGPDMNARAAWPRSTGEGVTIAIVDDGVDLAHPDLTHQQRSDLHWNFAKEIPDGNHPDSLSTHGTPVAGLAVAEANNNIGIVGMAPDAKFASWIVYNTNNSGGPFVDTNKLARMFRFHNDEVQVQNHSWVKPAGSALVRMSTVENEAIADATTKGRQGRGVVMVRAVGNDRTSLARNANDDQYLNDPRVITVAAVRPDGIVGGYSTPGAPILVSAVGGEQGFGSLFTTDRVGPQEGLNRITFPAEPALSDYVFSSLGFTGTSASTPLASGIVALVLSRNPSLTVRDVQQILALSATQPNPNDPDVQTNSAGLLVGHNAGYGLVNAGTAVDLAGIWKNRPAAVSSKTTVQHEEEIFDGGLLLAIIPQGGESPNLLINGLPSLGIHVDGSTPNVPLVYVGEAATPIQQDLRGKAALIQRGTVDFSEKIENAARAGALFAVVFNNQGTNSVLVMGTTDYVPIPAMSISQADGELLTNIVTQFGANARMSFQTAQMNFNVTDSLVCEHVKVTLNATHEQRSDMRITLVSPNGTRSVLQRFGRDLTAYPGEWTYTTTHHFYESSQGTWQLLIGDEAPGGAGTVHSATLEIIGVPIKDEDHDGLDDDWEMTHFNSLAFGPKDDPDLDGFSNAIEQVLGTVPTERAAVFQAGVSLWNDHTVRLSWPSRPGVDYEVLGRRTVTDPLKVLGEVTGTLDQTQWFQPITNRSGFFLLREKP